MGVGRQRRPRTVGVGPQRRPRTVGFGLQCCVGLTLREPTLVFSQQGCSTVLEVGLGPQSCLCGVSGCGLNTVPKPEASALFSHVPRTRARTSCEDDPVPALHGRRRSLT